MTVAAGNVRGRVLRRVEPQTAPPPDAASRVATHIVSELKHRARRSARGGQRARRGWQEPALNNYNGSAHFVVDIRRTGTMYGTGTAQPSEPSKENNNGVD